jgi:hypothetical protein
MTADRKRFQAGGVLQGESIYLERTADKKLARAIEQREHCFVLAPRQVGKTSLVRHAQSQAKARGMSTAHIDLSALGVRGSTPEQLCFSLIDQLALQLYLDDPTEFWERYAQTTHVERLARYFEEVALSSEKPLLLVLDEIDLVLAMNTEGNLAFRGDFFATLRNMFQSRSDPNTGDRWSRLVIVYVGLALPTDLAPQLGQTPFQFATGVDVADFTRDELTPLEAGLVFKGRDAAAMLDRVHHWLDGHPALTQKVCKYLVEHADDVEAAPDDVAAVDRAIEALFPSQSPEDDLIIAEIDRRFERLDKDEDTRRSPNLHADNLGFSVLDLYVRAGNGALVRANETVEQRALRVIGLGKNAKRKRADNGKWEMVIAPRNRVFTRYFSESWVHQRAAGREIFVRARKWETHGRPKALLLDRRELALLDTRIGAWEELGPLSDTEQAFITASQNQQRRASAAAALAFAGVGIAAVVAAGFAIYWGIQAKNRQDETERQRSQARRTIALVSAAQSAIGRPREAALLLPSILLSDAMREPAPSVQRTVARLSVDAASFRTSWSRASALIPARSRVFYGLLFANTDEPARRTLSVLSTNNRDEALISLRELEPGHRRTLGVSPSGRRFVEHCNHGAIVLVGDEEGSFVDVSRGDEPLFSGDQLEREPIRGVRCATDSDVVLVWSDHHLREIVTERKFALPGEIIVDVGMATEGSTRFVATAERVFKLTATANDEFAASEVQIDPEARRGWTIRAIAARGEHDVWIARSRLLANGALRRDGASRALVAIDALSARQTALSTIARYAIDRPLDSAKFRLFSSAAGAVLAMKQGQQSPASNTTSSELTTTQIQEPQEDLGWQAWRIFANSELPSTNLAALPHSFSWSDLLNLAPNTFERASSFSDDVPNVHNDNSITHAFNQGDRAISLRDFTLQIRDGTQSTALRTTGVRCRRPPSLNISRRCREEQPELDGSTLYLQGASADRVAQLDVQRPIASVTSTLFQRWTDGPPSLSMLAEIDHRQLVRWRFTEGSAPVRDELAPAGATLRGTNIDVLGRWLAATVETGAEHTLCAWNLSEIAPRARCTARQNGVFAGDPKISDDLLVGAMLRRDTGASLLVAQLEQLPTTLERVTLTPPLSDNAEWDWLPSRDRPAALWFESADAARSVVSFERVGRDWRARPSSSALLFRSTTRECMLWSPPTVRSWLQTEWCEVNRARFDDDSWMYDSVPTLLRQPMADGSTERELAIDRPPTCEATNCKIAAWLDETNIVQHLDVRARPVLSAFRAATPVLAMGWGARGMLALGSLDGEVRVWRIGQQQPDPPLRSSSDSPVIALAASDDEDAMRREPTVAIARADGSVSLVRQGAERVLRARGSSQTLRQLVLASDQRTIYGIAHDWSLLRITDDARPSVTPLRCAEHTQFALLTSAPDRRWIAAVAASETDSKARVCVWSALDNSRAGWTVSSDGGEIRAIALSNAAGEWPRIATVHSNEVRIWEHGTWPADEIAAPITAAAEDTSVMGWDSVLVRPVADVDNLWFTEYGAHYVVRTARSSARYPATFEETLTDTCRTLARLAGEDRRDQCDWESAGARFDAGADAAVDATAPDAQPSVSAAAPERPNALRLNLTDAVRTFCRLREVPLPAPDAPCPRHP